MNLQYLIYLKRNLSEFDEKMFEFMLNLLTPMFIYLEYDQWHCEEIERVLKMANSISRGAYSSDGRILDTKTALFPYQEELLKELMKVGRGGRVEIYGPPVRENQRGLNYWQVRSQITKNFFSMSLTDMLSSDWKYRKERRGSDPLEEKVPSVILEMEAYATDMLSILGYSPKKISLGAILVPSAYKVPKGINLKLENSQDGGLWVMPCKKALPLRDDDLAEISKLIISLIKAGVSSSEIDISFY